MRVKTLNEWFGGFASALMMSENSHDIVELPNLPSARPRRDEAELPIPSIALSSPSGLRWFFLFGVLFFPFLTAACYIIVTREWVITDPSWDYVGLALSLLTGLICLWQLPISWMSRLTFSVIYVPTVSYFLLHFALGFIGHRYGLWL